jgi:hypothetical protein
MSEKRKYHPLAKLILGILGGFLAVAAAFGGSCLLAGDGTMDIWDEDPKVILGDDLEESIEAEKKRKAEEGKRGSAPGE